MTRDARRRCSTRCRTSASVCRSTTSGPATPRCRTCKRLPIEEIKVDRSFVMQMHVDANDFMIVRATVDLGRNLGLRVVAEGVEDLATFDRLAEFGCDEAQGYYISRPLSAVGVHALAVGAQPRAGTVRPDGRRESDQRDQPGQRPPPRRLIRSRPGSTIAPFDRLRRGARRALRSRRPAGTSSRASGRARWRRPRQELPTVGPGEVGDRSQDPFLPQQLVGERRDVAHVDLGADDDRRRGDHVRSARGPARRRRRTGSPRPAARAAPRWTHPPTSRPAPARTPASRRRPGRVNANTRRPVGDRDLREDVRRAAEPEEPQAGRRRRPYAGRGSRSVPAHRSGAACRSGKASGSGRHVAASAITVSA